MRHRSVVIRDPGEDFGGIVGIASAIPEQQCLGDVALGRDKLAFEKDTADRNANSRITELRKRSPVKTAFARGLPHHLH